MAASIWAVVYDYDDEWREIQRVGLKAAAQQVRDEERALKTYHLLPSVRGDLLRKLGRFEEAVVEFERAASLTQNERERKLLLDRAAACERG